MAITSEECYLKGDCHRYKSGKECEKFCTKLYKINALYDNALLTKKQRQETVHNITANNKDEAAYKKLKSYLPNIKKWVSDGKSLYIHSKFCGNGKTAWAIKYVQEYVKSIWAESDPSDCKVLFVSVPKFLIEIKRNIGSYSEYANTVLNSVFTADLVVWDEIGSKAGTEYEIENILNIINDRINNGRSNIYTSNLNAEGLRACIGDRLYSRIVNLSDDIEFKNDDMRSNFK